MVNATEIERSYKAIKEYEESRWNRVCYNYGKNGDVCWLEGYVVEGTGPEGKPCLIVANKETITTVPWHNVVVTEVIPKDKRE